MRIKLLITVLTSCSILGCQTKKTFSGKSESEFKMSCLKVENDLDNQEKEKLKISLKLITEQKKLSNDKYLDIVDNKTYKDLINWTENHIDEKISELKQKIIEYKIITEKLNVFKATNLSIERTSSGVPILKMEVINTKEVTDFKGYLVTLDIYDIELNKLVDVYGFGSTFRETRTLNGENSSFSKKNYSLEQLANESKRIQKLLNTIILPTNNLKQFGIRTEFYVERLEFGNGTIINRPKYDLTFYESEINKLNETLENLK